jgi:hypothetical protein
LLARLWVRAVQRSQASFIAALQKEDARQAALAGALSILDFCDEYPADAQLLVAFRREDLIRSVPEGPLADELASRQMLDAPLHGYPPSFQERRGEP